MSSSRGRPTSVADNARREAKLLAQPTKLTLDPFGKTDVELKQPYPKELGPYAVIVIATPMTTMQFTIAHPIGVTDLEDNSWVAHRSDQIQGMLARAKDPNQLSLDQSRTAFRQQLAVQHDLLKKEEHDGKQRFFYPHRTDMDRNQLLEDARIKSKEATSQIKSRIAGLTDDKKRDKQGLMDQLRHAEDPINYLDAETSQAEKELRKFYQQPEVVAEILNKVPQLYRTLSGPYFTIPQVAIPDSKGLRIEDVAIRFARDLAKGTVAAPAKTWASAAPFVPGHPKPTPPSSVPPSKTEVKKTPPSDPPETGKKEGDDPKDPDSGKKGFMSRIASGTGKKG